MKLWEFSDDLRRFIVEKNLSHIGKVIEEFSTPYSNIYTLQNELSPKNYLIAKAPKINANFDSDQIEALMIKFLSEINNIHSVCNHSLISRFGKAEIIHGCPFLISTKKHMTLRDAIEKSPLSEVDTLVVTIQIVRALEYCSSKGIISHQDLKPENIFIDSIHEKFVTEGDYPYLYLAYLADLGMANAALLFQKPYGSRPYMAPEQYQNLKTKYPDVISNEYLELVSKEFDRSDIFSIGVLIVEMLTGGVHPIGEVTMDVWPKSIKGNKWSHEDVWKKWSKGDSKLNPIIEISNLNILKIINSCLSSDPINRPDSTSLKNILLDELKSLSTNAYMTINEYIDMVDQHAIVNEDAGWPYMDKLVSKLKNQL
jgi:serine/threonine protein kinase